MVGRDSAQYHPPRNEKRGREGDAGLRRVILRKLPSADILPEWKIDVLRRRSSIACRQCNLDKEGKGQGEKKLEDGERRGREREREIGSSTKIPQLYIHALLIFALLKDLSATRSAVIPAAPEYRSSIKRRRGNFLSDASIKRPENFSSVSFLLENQ